MAENVTLTNLTNLQNDPTATGTINTNNATITSAFVDVLSRSGISPNQMLSDLDMNGHRLMNLSPPIQNTDAARIIDVTNAALGNLTGSTTFGQIVSTWSIGGATNILLEGNAQPGIQFIPSLGSTKTGQIYQQSDHLIFGTAGVGVNGFIDMSLNVWQFNSPGNAADFFGLVGTLTNFIDHSVSSPLTGPISNNPSVYITRVETNNEPFGNAVSNGGLTVNVLGTNSGHNGSETNAIQGNAIKDVNSINDVLGVGGNSQHQGTAGTAFGGFFSGLAVGAGSWAQAIELAVGAANGQSIAFNPNLVPGYYGIDLGYSGSDFVTGGRALTSISNSSPNPAVFTLANHGLIAGMSIMLTTTGTLPSPLNNGTYYYVLAAGLTSSQFEVALTPGGAAVITTTNGSGTHKFNKIANGTAGIQIRTYSSDGNTDHTGMLDVGLAFMAAGRTNSFVSGAGNVGPIYKASIQSDDSSLNMWLGNGGTHNYGLNWTAVTFNNFAIATPGFSVNPTGAVTATGSVAVSGVGSQITVNSNAGAFYSDGGQVLVGAVQNTFLGFLVNNAVVHRIDTSSRPIWHYGATVTPATLATNGDVTMTPTSNTNLRFSYRGTDGTTRVANITLA